MKLRCITSGYKALGDIWLFGYLLSHQRLLYLDRRLASNPLTVHTANRYTVNRNDLDSIMIQLKKSTQNFQKPHGLETPGWWSENINELKTYKFIPDTSIWTFSIDNDNRIIYSWGKH